MRAGRVISTSYQQSDISTRLFMGSVLGELQYEDDIYNHKSHASIKSVSRDNIEQVSTCNQTIEF